MLQCYENFSLFHMAVSEIVGTKRASGKSAAGCPKLLTRHIESGTTADSKHASFLSEMTTHCLRQGQKAVRNQTRGWRAFDFQMYFFKSAEAEMQSPGEIKHQDCSNFTATPERKLSAAHRKQVRDQWLPGENLGARIHTHTNASLGWHEETWFSHLKHLWQLLTCSTSPVLIQCQRSQKKLFSSSIAITWGKISS